tara:strand:+ start:488 stop:841 length:354 start_codon:yes stop_codon:yes gene_type:complete
MSVLTDTLIGGISFGIISYISQPNVLGNGKYYFQVLGFLYAVPLTYFFLLLMASKISTTAMMNLTRHIMLGALLTILSAFICLYMQDMEQNIIIFTNLLVTILFIILYMGLDIYKLF